jgi:type IV pilus assembly protein PilA
MKKTNKKGFTIVELVIVIAVIAILAAVLIPTFANVVEKANKSAVLTSARNAYTELLAEDSVQGQPSKIAAFLTAAATASSAEETAFNAIKTDTGVTAVAVEGGVITFTTAKGTVTYTIATNAWGTPALS